MYLKKFMIVLFPIFLLSCNLLHLSWKEIEESSDRPTPVTDESVQPEDTPTTADDSSSISVLEECRIAVDGFNRLKKDLEVPDHLMSENPVRQPSDFDPNQYFTVLAHIQMMPETLLDYVYFTDEYGFGGQPVLYARKSSGAAFESYAELLQSYGEEGSCEAVAHDYLKYVQVDNSKESYFDFIVLSSLGDQFYLLWHSSYNDERILCDSSDAQNLARDLKNSGIELPQKVLDRIGEGDFTPTVIIDEKSATIRMVTFTKWGGFYENIFVVDKANPSQTIDSQSNQLIEYDCGIVF